MELRKSFLLGHQFFIHKVGTLHEIFIYDSLLFFEKIITLHVISSDEGKEREGMKGGREERRQNCSGFIFAYTLTNFSPS